MKGTTPSTRYLAVIAALTALALAFIVPRWRTPTLIDPCHDPYTFGETGLIPGSTPDREHQKPPRPLRLLDRAGHFENPVLPQVPVRYRILRDYEASHLAERPAARAAPEFEPETLSYETLSVGGREFEIAIVRGPRSEFVQVGAYVFLNASGPVGNATLSRLSQLIPDFVQGASADDPDGHLLCGAEEGSAPAGGGARRLDRGRPRALPGDLRGRRRWPMTERCAEKSIVVIPTYNAAETLRRVFDDIPKDCVDEIIVVDDCSRDATCEIARSLDVTLIEHDTNTGYGGNQKTCYRTALEHGADHVIMIHGDYQYDARMIPACIEILRLGICDVVLGNRIRTRKEALDGGMPALKYAANRALTMAENVLSGQNLGEWHSGFRAYHRRVLEGVPFDCNGDDFVFDTQFLVESVHFGFRLGDVPVPVRYFDEASSISLGDSTVYAVKTMMTFIEWYAHLLGLRTSPRFSRSDEAD